jgi:2-methylisocitrate lyase-like PEP mutase family enzyme
VIFPGGTARFVAKQLQTYYASLKRHGTSQPMRDGMFDFNELNALIGTPELLAKGRRYAG